MMHNKLKISLIVCATVTATTVRAQTPSDSQLEEVTVLGSRIPRTNAEGPSPIFVIDSVEMQHNGYASIADLLKALTQNGGETQSQQSFSAGDFTPGAQQVDLRGLGPNHTLVLVNGRRIADFPLPFNGKSNFTDISSIPLGMVDQIEVLSGSASAIYGSDAISGVVNFKLKKQIDGTTFDVRLSSTEAGGGASQRFSLSTGFNQGDFNVSLGLEFLNQEPLWAWNRSIQDSTADNPTTNTAIARRVFLRTDPNNDGAYIDPTAALCAPLAKLNNGTTYYTSRPNWGPADANGDATAGYYCGSNHSISYGTIISGRRGINAYAALSWDVSDTTQLFTDIQYGNNKVKLFTDVLDWQYQDANGSEDGVFFNNQTVNLDSWYRQFTPEEMGGLSRGMITNRQYTLSVTPGIKGSFDAHANKTNWNYEAYFNHSQYDATVSWPEIIRDKANSLFLGTDLGVDGNSGYNTFDADTVRLYTPLSRSEYGSIATFTNYKPKSSTDTVSVTINTPALMQLSAGPIGFAAVAEFGTQRYSLNPDPLALTHYYYHLRDADGAGSRNHGGAGFELRAPIIKTLQASAAARYDGYRFANSSANRFTYNAGLEWRPSTTLLLRAALGTGFRAPDLHYVFAGPGNTHPSATDYYLCRRDEPDTDIGDCSSADEGIVESRVGNRKLQSETSKSLSYGIVWAPTSNFKASLDFFDIELDNAVLDMNIDSLLRIEADCRLGSTTAGSTVDANSPTCQDTIARVHRYAATSAVTPDGLIGVSINPINIAREYTSGFDFTLHYLVPTGVGNFSFNTAYTKVNQHTLREYRGDPEIDEFKVDSNFDIPRSKASASISWEYQQWTITLHGERLDQLPNYDEVAFIPATYLMNASVQWKITDHSRVSFAVDNLLNKMPPKDSTYASYPYYDISWFDSVGRSYYLQMTYKFGGKL